MARPKKLKEQEVIDALKQSHGLKTGAAEILGVAYNTIDAYVAESDEAKAVIEHYRIRRTDRAQYKLDEAIERGEAWAVALQLKDSKSGKERGYGNAVDVNQTGDMRIVIEYADAGNQNPVTKAAPRTAKNKA